MSGEWVECVVDDEFEIFSEYPYPLRRKGKDRIVKESINSNGYVQLCLNGKTYKKHRIVALQFLENDDPEHKTEIDHRDHNRANNHIENLRWVSHSENQKNKAGCRNKFIYHDELPETAESLDSYNGHDLDGVFVDYELKKVYLFNGLKYRELVICRNGGRLFYNVQDIENKRVALYPIVLFG